MCMNRVQEPIIATRPNLLVLVRHGESVNNQHENLMYSGKLKTYPKVMKETRNADFYLSSLGRKQALKTGAYLKRTYKQFDAVFSSPYQRTFETASIIGAKVGVSKIEIDERIREKESGIWNGLTYDEVKRMYPSEYERKLREKKYYYRPIGGESYPDVNLRVWSFMSMLIRDCSGLNVCVVTHAAVLMAFRTLLDKLNEKQVLSVEKNDVKNCSITVYQFDPLAKPRPKLALESHGYVAW